MKAERIAAWLLEDDELEDFLSRHSDDPKLHAHAEQINGDFGDPWLYGGAWLLPTSHEIVYIHGMEGEGVEEIQPRDVEVPERIKNKIVKRLGGDPTTWSRRSDPEHDIEDAIDAWQERMAGFMNRALELHVYRWSVEPVEDWVDVNGIRQTYGMSQDDWDSLPEPGKLIAAAEYHGLENFDSYPHKFTKAGLSKYLGVKL